MQPPFTSRWKYPHPSSSSTKPSPRGPIHLVCYPSKHEHTNVPTGPRTESEHCEHCSVMYRGEGLTDTNSATTTTKMPAYNPYTLYIPSPMMEQSQFTAGEGHKVVCAHASEPCDLATGMSSGFGVPVESPVTSYTPLISPTYTAKLSILTRQSPISPSTFLHTTSTTILLWHLNQPIT